MVKEKNNLTYEGIYLDHKRLNTVYSFEKINFDNLNYKEEKEEYD